MHPKSDPRSTWSPDDIRRVAHRVADMIADYLAEIPNKAVFRPVPRDVVDTFLTEAPPQTGSTPDAILDDFERSVAPYPFGNGHPRFWGWVNSPPAVIGIFADALAAAMNPSVAGGNHAAVYVERQVLNWFKQIVGFPPSAMGLLVSGGSVATLTGLAVARHVRAGFDVRAQGLQSGGTPLAVYGSSETHGCVRKAVELLGIGTDAYRVVPVRDDFTIDLEILAARIAEDRAKGMRPIAVVASAGTVNTGAIDPIDGLAGLCHDEQLWLHVDAAYGGPAILTAEYREALRPLSRADSIGLDPHKWLYVPVEAGLVLVKDADRMRSTFSIVPPYLRTDGNPSGVGGLPWFSEYGIQQSRAFRALKVWMALKYYGLDGYAEAISHNIALARYLADQVRSAADFELLAAPSLSIVCFRYIPPALAESGAERLDEVNKLLLERLQLSGRAFLSSTVVRDLFALRACIVNPLTNTADIDELLVALRELAAEECRASFAGRRGA